jgi:hypothetical protein
MAVAMEDGHCDQDNMGAVVVLRGGQGLAVHLKSWQGKEPD